MKMRYSLAAAVLAGMVAATAAARADQVTDQINKALADYGKKDLKQAATALQTATTLVTQQEADQWKAMLPKPLAGWTAQKTHASALSPMIFGGAITVSRTYQKGPATVTLTIVTHSPMVQMVAGMLSGAYGAMLGTAGQLVMIGGHRTLHSKNDRSYETLVGNSLVKVEGNPSSDDASLRQYLKAVDFAGVKRLAS